MTNTFIRKNNRLYGFDYNANAHYFITTCVDKKIPCLSKINGEKTLLTTQGKIIETYLNTLKTKYPHIQLGEYSIMPNHIHLILFRSTAVSKIGIIQYISALKTLTSRDIRLSGLTEFKWQKSYYDRVIRSDMEYYNIANYIQNNPSRWAEDIENPVSSFKKTESEYYRAIFEILNP